MKGPHPRLIPLLKEHGLDWEVFRKRGRPPKGVREKRAAIVTELHQKGTSWAEMMEITGLSNGSIQRLTKAMWNPATRETVREVGRKLGASWKGRPRPGQLEAQWKAGTFDFFRGKVLSEEERAHLRASWTPELRRDAAEHSRNRVWGDPDVRARLLAFHRSPEQRARYSRAQTRRMQETPKTYLRGRASWVDTPKGDKDRVYVRSSYEAATVRKLEADPNVVSYQFEPRQVLPDGKWVLPDFFVTYTDGREVLVEVKAQWVFGLPPSHQVHQRLKVSQDIAARKGWGFEVWTEKELGDALQRTA